MLLPESKPCDRCGKPIPINRGCGNRVEIARPVKYCSHECAKRKVYFVTSDPKPCERCGKLIPVKHGMSEYQYLRRKYCSKKCRNGYVPQNNALSTGQIGAMNELIVSADLIRRRVHVFRAVSPSSPCDLIIILGGQLLRVEVTTGNRHLMANGELGKLCFISHNHDKYDILAVVTSTEGIVYIPPLPEL